MERYVTEWEKLTESQKAAATSSYQAVRSVEEEEECDLERAENSAPFCRGYWIDDNGGVTVNI